MISNYWAQSAATFRARTHPTAKEEIAGTAVCLAAAPAVRLQETSLPGALQVQRIGVPDVGYMRSGVAQTQAVRMTFVDPTRVVNVPGSAPRGRPV
jgi:hypothetical protein